MDTRAPRYLIDSDGGTVVNALLLSGQHTVSVMGLEEFDLPVTLVFISFTRKLCRRKKSATTKFIARRSSSVLARIVVSLQ